MSLLNTIKQSADIKIIEEDKLPELAEEIRQEIITIVSNNGGHLASNLGIVELTMALHYCYNIPRDKIIWDVGHQSYVHKMLTGRADRMNTIRQHAGLSGFPKRSESPADPFGAGHASTAISAALGVATARDHNNDDYRVVAIVGDGALTGGLSFEGLNNAGNSGKDLLVILNDNKMSISENVGALSKYLTNILTDKRFNKLRNDIWELTGRFKRRDKIRATISDLEDAIKGIFVPGYLFDKLGFRYFGPIDGHDLPLLVKTINQLQDLKGPRLLHVVTKKGKGFAPAEADATRFHGIGSFDKVTGKSNAKSGLPSYTNVFGDTIVELAEKDKRIVAISAAMCSGTGLTKFSEKYPDRFYDVGIAEGHAVCFAGGLATEGLRPHVAIYSTFLQRAYDQIIHDVALQKLPVIFCIDRAGIVGDDGPTHHGCFDLSYLSTVPNITVMIPKDGDELRSMMKSVSDRELDGPVAIRYPRGSVPYEMTGEMSNVEWGKWHQLRYMGDTVVLAVGSMVDVALKAHEELKDEIDFSLINARFIKPMDYDTLDYCMKSFKNIITIEENSHIGGFGQMVAGYLCDNTWKGNLHSFAIPDKFIEHGKRNVLLDEIGLNSKTLVQFIQELHSARGGLFSKLAFRRGNSKRFAAVHNNSHKYSNK